MGPDSADEPSAHGVFDEGLGRFSGVAPALVSGCYRIADFHHALGVGRPFEPTCTDDLVLGQMHQGKPMLPRICHGREPQLGEPLRGRFTRDEEVPDAFGESKAEFLLVELRTRYQRPQMLRRIRNQP